MGSLSANDSHSCLPPRSRQTCHRPFHGPFRAGAFFVRRRRRPGNRARPEPAQEGYPLGSRDDSRRKNAPPPPWATSSSPPMNTAPPPAPWASPISSTNGSARHTNSNKTTPKSFAPAWLGSTPRNPKAVLGKCIADACDDRAADGDRGRHRQGRDGGAQKGARASSAIHFATASPAATTRRPKAGKPSATSATPPWPNSPDPSSRGAEASGAGVKPSRLESARLKSAAHRALACCFRRFPRRKVQTNRRSRTFNGGFLSGGRFAA